jgi:hypothetical protein
VITNQRRCGERIVDALHHSKRARPGSYQTGTLIKQFYIDVLRVRMGIAY